jgi:hypothetical protein
MGVDPFSVVTELPEMAGGHIERTVNVSRFPP